MRKILIGLYFLFATVAADMAAAQQQVWIQIKAERTLARAREAARDFATRVQPVSGFALRNGWFAVALGPFGPNEAQDTLQQLRITRQIPTDSYITDGAGFGARFWPIGAGQMESGQIGTAAARNETPAPETTPPGAAGTGDAGTGGDTVSAASPAGASPASASPAAADETPAQARQSERLLSRAERELVQTALKAEGLYGAAIDGAIGPGTRRSMAAWQSREGFEPTGVLTSGQRQILLDRYRALRDSLGIAEVVDDVAGIRIDLPLGLVAFDRYDPPFAKYAGKTGIPLVLLISQTGDRASLRALYDVMQTLDVVPLSGKRSLKKTSFTLTGEDDRITSYTYAALSGNAIKGFTLVWPRNDAKRRKLVLAAMRDSFRTIGGQTMPDVVGDSAENQSIDLLAGLAIRRPRVTRSGFFVSETGAVLTSATAVRSCKRVTIGDDTPARIAAVNDRLGLALVLPEKPLAPLESAALRSTPERLGTEVSVSGYSYGGRLGAPTLTYGRLAELRGLNGEDDLERLTLETTQADAGGPVLDPSGAVVGVLLDNQEQPARRLPESVRFAARARAVARFLDENGIATRTQGDGAAALSPEDLATRAESMTVLVSCWDRAAAP